MATTAESYRSLRIVFMGTPEFAVASLDALLQAGCNIVGVITAPDKPAGRGMKLTESAVKKYALEKNLHILQPEKLKNPEFIEALRSLKADLQIVVAFRMLPEQVWNMPPLGTINLHGSLLPRYRGAAPINWAVINGDKETGVTTFKLQHAIDTGNILMQEAFPIGPDETAGAVHDRMKAIGAQLLVKTVQALAAGILKEVPQQEWTSEDLDRLPHAPKLFTDTCRIDTAKSAAEVHNLIRGLSPFPGAFTTLDGKTLKIYSSTLPPVAPEGVAPVDGGRFLTDGRGILALQCSNGLVLIRELQLEGKKRMPAEEFLRGYRFIKD